MGEAYGGAVRGFSSAVRAGSGSGLAPQAQRGQGVWTVELPLPCRIGRPHRLLLGPTWRHTSERLRLGGEMAKERLDRHLTL